MDVTVQNLGEAAAFFARHYGRDVDLGEDGLMTEGFREHRTIANLFADGFDVGLELGVGEALGKQIEALENGQSGANQRNELLVEDQELFKIKLFAAAD